MRLAVHSWGSGPRVVLVHGGVLGGRHAWREQRPLTERWTLVAPDRLGHGDSPPGRQDFEVDARLLAEQLLAEPCHLVGLSYGAIVAALAAAARPRAVRSLALVEPPAARVARGDAEVARWDASMRAALEQVEHDLSGGLRSFFGVLGVPAEVPDGPLPEPVEQGARQLAGARPPGDAELPLAALRAAPFPKLVVSGGHLGAVERICDRIAAGIGAERAVVRGLGHAVAETGEPFNAVLERFLAAAQAASSPADVAR